VFCNCCLCVDVWTFVSDADEEAFEDNAEEYMRRDVEGSGIQLIFCVFIVRKSCTSYSMKSISYFIGRSFSHFWYILFLS